MVRNTTSTPNLRDNMNETRPALQLRGADEYTKSLMNRIAIGQATEAERLLFDERVQKMQTTGSNASPASPLRSVSFGPAKSEETVQQTEADQLPDYAAQLALLEAQNIKRLVNKQGLGARQQDAQNEDTLLVDLPSMPEVTSGNRPNSASGASMEPEGPLKSNRKKKPEMKARKGAKKISIPVDGPAHEEGQKSYIVNEKQGVDSGQFEFFAHPYEESAQIEQLSNLSLHDKLGKKNKKKKDKQKKPAKLLEIHKEPIDAPRATREAASVYTQPFCDFLTNNPTVFHAVDSQKKQLLDLGWTELDERKKWDIVPGGKYFVERNGSSMIAFSVGENYEPGNGCAIIAGHVDALTAKLKPISEVTNKAGYLQLGVAPYGGALNSTWWDRDLGIGGRVLVKADDKIVTKLVKLDWPIARIPTLAPHFGAAASGPFNKETQMVPIIGLEGTEISASDFQISKAFSQPPILGGENGPVGNFVNTQPPALVKVIGNAIGLTKSTYGNIVNWELELFDIQPATVGGLNKEFVFAGRLDDKLCSWAAMQALISGQQWNDTRFSSVIKMVGWFDNEEIGSQLRQGAKSNFLPLTIERVVGCLGQGKKGANLVGRTYANSFLLSSDVTHAVNPNFLGAYLENHSPHLNVGLSVHADPNGNMTTDAVSTTILQRCAESVGAKLQVFQIRNDSRSGGTVGPMLSAMTGIRAIDAGLPQLSMHSIRATTGSLDPGLGVITYMGFLNRFEHIDKEFRN